MLTLLSLKLLKIKLQKHRQNEGMLNIKIKKDHMKCDNKPYDSILSESQGLEGYAKELEEANAQLEMINYF